MDLTAANSVIGAELDSPAAKNIGNSNENFLSSNSSSIITIVNHQQDLYNCNNQIYNMQQKEDIVLLNSVTSEYQRRKEMLEEEINKQKTALVTSAKERKTKLKQIYNAAYTAMNTKSKQAYNAAYRAMTNAKIHAYQQLTSPKDKLLNCANDDDQEEQEKISKKRKALVAAEKTTGEMAVGTDTVGVINGEQVAVGENATIIMGVIEDKGGVSYGGCKFGGGE